MALVGLTSDLMGVGFSGGQAAVIGDTLTANLACVGTAQVGAAPVVNSVTTLTTSAGQTAAVLPASWPLLSNLLVYNNSATAATVFPPVGGTIDNGAANTSVAIAQNRGRIFVRLTNTAWITVYGA